MLGLYRLYFGKQPVNGFFLEGDMGIISGNYDNYVYTFPYDIRKTYISFGVGIALGWKWHIEKSNIVLDIFGGAGRLLSEKHDGVYPRMGICVGKRF